MLDQNAYAALLRNIAHVKFARKKVGIRWDLNHSLYWSLLGAIAVLSLNGVDVAVFVAALQRAGHGPEVIHDRKDWIALQSGSKRAQIAWHPQF